MKPVGPPAPGGPPMNRPMGPPGGPPSGQPPLRPPGLMGAPQPGQPQLNGSFRPVGPPGGQVNGLAPSGDLNGVNGRHSPNFPPNSKPPSNGHPPFSAPLSAPSEFPPNSMPPASSINSGPSQQMPPQFGGGGPLPPSGMPLRPGMGLPSSQPGPMHAQPNHMV